MLELVRIFGKHHNTRPLRVLLHGLGGCGKTQLALHFANSIATRPTRESRRYQGILWLRADCQEALLADIALIAKLINPKLDEGQPFSIFRDLVISWLQSSPDWLVILDNVSDATLVRDHFPLPGSGSVLITSRFPVLDALGVTKRIEIKDFSPEEATGFLLARTQRESTQRNLVDTREIARDLSCFPLALEQAASYIVSTQISFSDYRVSYAKRRIALLEETPPRVGAYPQTVFTTWTMNFMEVQRRSEAAADILRAAALLYPADLPYELFIGGARHLGPNIAGAIAETADDPARFLSCLLPLTELSLVTHEPDRGCFTIHRLVQEVQRHKLTDEELSLWAHRVVMALHKTFPVIDYLSSNKWPMCRRLLPHAKYACELAQSKGFVFLEAITLACNVGFFSIEWGLYDDALHLYETALAMSKKAGLTTSLGPTILNGLGAVYRIRCQYQRAEKALRDALRIQRGGITTLEGKINLGLILNSLGVLYLAAGQYRKSKHFLQKALDLRKSLGKRYSLYSCASLNDLGVVHLQLGQLPDCFRMHNAALRERLKVLGPDHPYVARSRHNLGIAFMSKGEIGRAEDEFREALRIRQSAYGDFHPAVAGSLAQLGALYCRNGQLENAETALSKALELRNRLFPSDHHDVASSENLMGELRYLQGRLEEAESYLLQSLSKREASLGKHHPYVAFTLENLAGVHTAQGQHLEARSLLRRCLKIREHCLPARHPLILATKRRLSET